MPTLPMPRKSRPRARCRGGFTLLELSAVLVIMALLAASAAVSVRPALAQASINAAVNRWIATDQRLREQADSAEVPIEVTLDLDAGTLLRRTGENRSLSLEQGLPLRSLRTGTKEYRSGAILLRYLCDGASPTYAVELGVSPGRSTYLLVTGGTGQILRMDQERDVDHVLRSFANH